MHTHMGINLGNLMEPLKLVETDLSSLLPATERSHEHSEEVCTLLVSNKNEAKASLFYRKRSLVLGQPGSGTSNGKLLKGRCIIGRENRRRS